MQYVNAIFKVAEKMLITLEVNICYFHKLLKYFKIMFLLINQETENRALILKVRILQEEVC